jgi:hypothetical protein
VYLKQSTAATIVLGPFVDSTDGVTAETALTISQADIRLSKNGGAFAQTNNATGATHMENGNYSVPLDTTDTNTLGRLRVAVAESGALPVWLNLEIVPANVWDSLFSTDLLQVDVTQLLGTAWLTPGTAGTPDVNVKLISDDATAANNCESFFDGTGYAGTNNVIPTVTTTGTATNVTTVNGLAANVITATSIATGAITAAKFAASAIDAAALAADAVAEIADGVWDEPTAGHVAAGSTGAAIIAAGSAGDPWSTSIPGAYGAGTAGKIVGDNLNATVSSRASQTSLDTVDDLLDTEIAAIKAKTDLIPSDPADASDIAALIDALPTAAENFTAVLTTAMTESYAADGAAPTLAQAIFLMQQSLHEFSISGTTRTVKKLDGSTTAATFTLDSSTAPTSTTRAT